MESANNLQYVPLIATASALGFVSGALAGLCGGAPLDWGISNCLVAFFGSLFFVDLSRYYSRDVATAITSGVVCGVIGLLIGAWIHSSLVPWRFLDSYTEFEKCAAPNLWSQKKRNTLRVAWPLTILALFWASTTGVEWTKSFRTNTGYLPRIGLAGMLRQSYRLATQRQPEGRSLCQSNLKHISLAMLQYIQDNDEHFPLVAVGGEATFGWADAIQPYLKSTQVLQCPQEFMGDASSDPRATGYTDYWYNNRLSGLNLSSVTSMGQTVMLGDGNDSVDVTDARYRINSFPAQWTSSPTSPIHRHYGGTNYGFADGHVKWLRGAIGAAPAKRSGATFSPQ